MSDNKNLVPVEQKQVICYDDEITTVIMDDGNIFVPIRPLCDNLNVDWSGQRQRILRDPVLSEVTSGVVVAPAPLSGKFTNPQEMLCIPLDYLAGCLGLTPTASNQR